ncbi:GNAT family N-acetyltransferase [Paenibacillus aquistagni]|uniref:Predicted N-acetyltransferase YhbS n=1 Tax=Paenibacillus aquistagni TaxID=1852522 RepID=A0A1X7IS90_9BACL|nr:GNAT family N-acetyltransferase [Paenibacillus aquistagni]NMM51103.1 GNAT family N-acetyltransferase [Paenibacillus aquistagni]SMG18063.1 Predicted N-acetyltransferase YhbS [Paenibacillus aquistagni]
MIKYRSMKPGESVQIVQIDRSEYIPSIFEMKDGELVEIPQNHECTNWDEDTLREIQTRYEEELSHGGAAYGAYDGEKLVGFGVLAHKWRGDSQDQLQLDLMYVSRTYRRQGIGSRIIQLLEDEARRRGAKWLYISSTETESAVSFYKRHSGQITEQVDRELYDKEPLDIHMLKKL